MPSKFIEALETRNYFSTGANFFPIGVFSQPTYSFGTWQSRGVNTLVAYESQGGSVTVDQWAAAADAVKMYQIRQPSSNIKADTKDKYLLSWFLSDEPEINGVSVSTIASWSNGLHAVKNAKPVFINYSGANLLDGNTSASMYQQYLQYTDWVGTDLYPVTGWGRPDWIDLSQSPADRMNEGQAVEAFAQLSNNDPQFAFIETSNQNLSWTPPGTTGPSAAQFRGEVWDAIIHGAKGIVYFPQQFNGFSYDATPPDVVAEMTTQDARIQSVANVLNSAPNPANSIWQLNSLGSPDLEGTVRVVNGQRYYFVLNMSSQTLSNQQVNIPGLLKNTKTTVVGENRNVKSGMNNLTDSFAPYELHIYRLPALSIGLPIFFGRPVVSLPTLNTDGSAASTTFDLLGNATDATSVLN